MPASAKLLHRYASPLAAIVSPRRYCAVHTAVSLIRSADRHHRIATFALLALRLTYIRILSIAVAILRHFMLSPPQSRRALVLPIRRHGCAARFDRSAVTMIICPSEGYVIRRRVGTYCRSASRLRRAICAVDVLYTPFDALPTYRDARASRRLRSPLISAPSTDLQAARHVA